jgi:aryl-alcohol dehydrogenase-like predicted oxidoreductase
MPTDRKDAMQTRTIGPRSVSAIGLGGMPMSIEGRPDEGQAISTVHAALEAGITFIDTADAYHQPADGEPGHNERLIAKALRSYGGDTSGVLVATKGGLTRPVGSEGAPWPRDGRPEYLKEAAKASAKRLGVDAIGLYQFHRHDFDVPYADSVGALRDLLDEGVIQLAGISNADLEQIAIAQDVLGGRLASVQNQFSPVFLSSRAELEHCAAEGIAFLPWSPLGGIGRNRDSESTFGAFQRIADARGVSPQQVTLAWELALAPNVIPIPGASRPASIQDSAQAVDLTLTSAELSELEASL